LISAIDGIGRTSSLAKIACPRAAPCRVARERAVHHLLDVGAGAKGSAPGASDRQRTGVAARNLINGGAEIA